MLLLWNKLRNQVRLLPPLFSKIRSVICSSCLNPVQPMFKFIRKLKVVLSGKDFLQSDQGIEIIGV